MASVVVTPLQPPFKHHREVMHFHFAGKHTILTVSVEDGERIKAMLGGDPTDRTIVLEPIDGNDIDIRISVLQ
jgi:hypothetical protein